MQAIRAAAASSIRFGKSVRLFSSIGVECTAPFVSEKVVGVTLIDFRGNRQDIQGREGQTLMEAAKQNQISWLIDDSDGGGATYNVIRNPDFHEDLYGEGSSSPMCHVVVSNEWYDKIPAKTFKEEEVLEYVPEEDLTPTSRLATEIILTKALNGLVVAVPEPPAGDHWEDFEEPEEE